MAANRRELHRQRGSHRERQARLRVLEALDQRARQFRSHENIWPFRIPHEPLSLVEIIDDALADNGSLRPEALRSRTVLELTFGAALVQHTWQAWAIALPSGISLYVDDDGEETRVLASARRGNPLDADGFFLELLAETGGGAFGIEMSAALPERVRTSIEDRDFLVDVFVELFEGSDAEAVISRESRAANARGRDFRADVERWLARVLVAPRTLRAARRQPRRREENPV